MSHSIEPSSLLGTLLGQRYAIQSALGRGGFGITYLASDQVLHRKVAIKEFFLAGSQRREGTLYLPTGMEVETYHRLLQRFTDEARALAKFNHQNIVRILDIFEANSTAYIVMEYVVGETLASYLRREGPLPVELGLEMAHKLCTALELVHAQGLLHRDIKPENVLLNGDFEPILIDFGAARSFSPGDTAAMTVILTPGFAPPEQYGADGHFGPELDLYALAATLYYSVSGTMPLRDRGTDLKLNLERVPNGLRTALIAALHMDPNRRPQSVNAFRQLLTASTLQVDEEEGKPTETAREFLSWMDPVSTSSEVTFVNAWPFARQTFAERRQFTLDAVVALEGSYTYSDRLELGEERNRQATGQHAYVFDRSADDQSGHWPLEARIVLFERGSVYNKLEFVYQARAFSEQDPGDWAPETLGTIVGMFRRCLQAADPYWRAPDHLDIQVRADQVLLQLWYFQRMLVKRRLDATGVVAHLTHLMQEAKFAPAAKERVNRTAAPAEPELDTLEAALDATSLQLYSRQDDRLFVKSQGGSLYVLELLGVGLAHPLPSLKISRYDLLPDSEFDFGVYTRFQILDRSLLSPALKPLADTAWVIGAAHTPAVELILEEDQDAVLESFCTYPLVGPPEASVVDWLVHHLENRHHFFEAKAKGLKAPSILAPPVVIDPDLTWLQPHALLEFAGSGFRWEAKDDETIQSLSPLSEQERTVFNLPKKLMFVIGLSFNLEGPSHLPVLSIHAHTKGVSFAQHAELLQPVLVKGTAEGQSFPVVLGSTGNLVVKQILPFAARPHPLTVSALVRMARHSLLVAALVLLKLES